MKTCLKNNKHLNKNKRLKKVKKVFRTNSIAILAKNLLGEMPFVSKSVKQKYNKYLLNKHKDKLLNIKNFLNRGTSQKDQLTQIFEKLNLVRIKIKILESDVKAYNVTKQRSPKENNYFIKKIIERKYAKLRKFDDYQNLLLAKIYDLSTLGDKIKKYEKEAERQEKLIRKKFNQPDELKKLQKKFIFSLIYDRQTEDKIFKENVTIDQLMDILINDPLFDSSISNIETYTYNFLYKNKGALSKDFIAFQAKNNNSSISTIVKKYLELYRSKYPNVTTTKLDEIQKSLLKGFNYSTFKDSEIFSDLNTEISLNELILKAKINFAKSQMCQELEYCMDMPEINNYFKIIYAKDSIKNYAISRERLFVEKIEKEFAEIKSSNFIYLYNDVKETLQNYKNEITESEFFFIRDFIESVILYELADIESDEEFEDVLNDIRIGIYKDPRTYVSKNNMDMYFKILTTFNYYLSFNMISFKELIEDSKLFHGVLVTKELKPVIPQEIQKNIINLSRDAQIELAKNSFYVTILNNLDNCFFSTSGDLFKPNKRRAFKNYTKTSIRNLTLTTEIIYFENYIKSLSQLPRFANEVEAAKYILNGLNDTLKDSISDMIEIPEDSSPAKELLDKTIKTQTTTAKPIEDNDLDQDLEDIDKTQELDEATSEDLIEDNEILTEEHTPSNANTSITTNEELPDIKEDKETPEAKEARELTSFKQAQQYISLILEEKDENKQKNMLLRLQKRANSQMLALTEISIENLNNMLKKANLSLLTAKEYVESLIAKYKADKKDIKRLEVGIKLRVRTGSIILTDDEIDDINMTNNLSIVQKSSISHTKQKQILSLKYIIKTPLPEIYKEKLRHPAILIRKALKGKNSKISSLDYRLFEIMNK